VLSNDFARKLVEKLMPAAARHNVLVIAIAKGYFNAKKYAQFRVWIMTREWFCRTQNQDCHYRQGCTNQAKPMLTAGKTRLQIKQFDL
jgi:hypothetical protein